MKKKTYINIEIDSLTNSIVNALSGDSFDTEVLPLSKKDIKNLKKRDWNFDWKAENKKADRSVFKLIIEGNENIIQGLISLSDENDHIFMHLIESAIFNKGKIKAYVGIPGNLIAFACKVSFENGYEGFVAFESKSALIKHYQETLFAKLLGGNRMYIDGVAAKRLIKQYFK